MLSLLSTAFKYSRFGATHAMPPRDAAAMHSGLVGPKARAPAWDAAGGIDKLVGGLNFAGNDLTSLRGPKTARACYRACEKTKGCAAFTFIASQEKTAPKSKCWLKKAGYHRGAEHAVGTVSGVVRRE